MYEYENEHRPAENQQSYAYNFSPEPPVHQPEQHPQKKRGGAGKLSAEERKQLDIEYAKHYSPWMDLRIILKTFLAFVQKEDV